MRIKYFPYNAPHNPNPSYLQEADLPDALISACPTIEHLRALIIAAIIDDPKNIFAECPRSPFLENRRLHAIFNDSRQAPTAPAGSGELPVPLGTLAKGTAEPCPSAPQGLKAQGGWAWELERLHYLLEQELPKWDHQAELRAATEEAFDEGLESAKEDALSATHSLREWVERNQHGLTGVALMAELDRRIAELGEESSAGTPTPNAPPEEDPR